MLHKQIAVNLKTNISYTVFKEKRVGLKSVGFAGFKAESCCRIDKQAKPKLTQFLRILKPGSFSSISHTSNTE